MIRNKKTQKIILLRKFLLTNKLKEATFNTIKRYLTVTRLVYISFIQQASLVLKPNGEETRVFQL